MRHFMDHTGLIVLSMDDSSTEPAPDGMIEIVLPDDSVLEEVFDDSAPGAGGEDGQAEFDAPPKTPVGLRLPSEAIRPACEWLIEAMHTRALSVISGRASAEEISTWLPKKQWATEALDPGAPRHQAAVAALAGMVPDVEAQAQGLGTALEKAQYLANRILALASVYEAAVVQVERARREAYVALAATPDDDAALFALMATIKDAADARLAQFREAMGI